MPPTPLIQTFYQALLGGGGGVGREERNSSEFSKKRKNKENMPDTQVKLSERQSLLLKW